MDYSNYTIFEILKYKIEFLECLEYSLLLEIPKNKIKEKLTYLNNNFKKGTYKEIVSTLFTSFNLLNQHLIHFFKKYNDKNIFKFMNSKNVSSLIKYNENIIKCNETFNYIISAFTEEKEIAKKLDNKIINLITTSDEYYINFMFYNNYNIYLNCFCSQNNKLKCSFKNLKRLINIFSYCNKTNIFNDFIDILYTGNTEKIYKNLNLLSKKCISKEESMKKSLDELVVSINEERNNIK